MGISGNPCSNCDSTSMEMCLLIMHCKHWVTRGEREEGGDSAYSCENHENSD